jgi:hypothetical protein
MRKIGLLLALGLLALGGGQAIADQCTIEAVPAATLLLPYFEVDFETDQASAVTTLFSINNASAAPTVVHVTFWTNWSFPTIDFDIYLTGYDVQTVNLRDVFEFGNLPRTAHANKDPGDSISPHGGEFSNNPTWDPAGIFGSCDNIFPFNNPVLGASNRARIQQGHTGQPTATAALGCFGAPTDNAVGYITFDNVNTCSTVFPSEPGYFVDGGLGIANNENVLWGDYFIVDPGNNFAFGDTLVAVEAFDCVEGTVNAVCPPIGGAAWDFGDYTFYGRFNTVVPTGGADNREPLATTWATRYLNNTVFTGGTDLLVWRDSKQDPAPGSAICGVGPSWFALGETQVAVFNESEDVVEICDAGGVISPQEEDQACFPLETQRVQVGEDLLLTPFQSGWLFLNLNHNNNPALFNQIGTAQSWVTPVMSADGRFQVGFSAIQLDTACDGIGPTLEIEGFIENEDQFP